MLSGFLWSKPTRDCCRIGNVKLISEDIQNCREAWKCLSTDKLHLLGLNECLRRQKIGCEHSYAMANVFEQ